ncbi:MAG: hypothetical protein SGJ18_02040 [Pseudomonadota bacterium]|nr:hypothetical protein [Pseudomonadota bacterium]
MFFSCKITNSVIRHLHSQGQDLDPIIEAIDVPKEFLEDPSYWLDAAKIETFLREVDLSFTEGTQSIITKIGHLCPTLKSWGVLDSVLRMMKEPQDMFSQPQRFLSYFISPAPPICDISRKDDSVSFTIPLTPEEFPFTSLFIKSALESLPVFVSSNVAAVKWQSTKIEISWSKDQGNLFPDEQMERHMSPDFMSSLEMVIENTQKEVEEKNRELVVKQKEIAELTSQLEAIRLQVTEGPPQTDILTQVLPSLVKTRGQVLKLSDYLVRAQQMITLLIGKQKKSDPIMRALAKLDWEVLLRDFPKSVQMASDELQYIRETLEKHQNHNRGDAAGEDRESVDLNQVIESALETLRSNIPSDVKVETQLSLGQKIKAYPKGLSTALSNILSYSIQSLKGRGELRIAAYPYGNVAHLEISDSSTDRVIDRNFELREAKAIVKKHNGILRISHVPGFGATYSIDLPVN